MHTSLFLHAVGLYKFNVSYSFTAAHLSITNQVSIILTIFFTGIVIYIKIVYVKSFVYRAVTDYGYINKKSNPKRCHILGYRPRQVLII